NIKRLFELSVEERENFKEINSYINIIIKLVKKYNYTIPEAIRFTLPYIPKSNFKSFMERLATSIDIGEDMSEFLYKEYQRELSVYDANYKKGLENTRLLQDLVISLSSSLAFTFSLILFIPFLLEVNPYILLINFLIIFVTINLIIYYVSKYFIPEDSLWTSSKEKPREYMMIRNYFIIIVTLSYILFLILLFVVGLPLLPSFAIAITPLTYVSYRIINLEKILKTKEKYFPSFFVSVVEYSEIFGSNQTKILNNVVVHDFGLLNEDIEKLRKRITITKNYSESWKYFISELGSRLAEKIIKVFEKVLEYNGDTKNAGDMLYNTLIKMIELRSRKEQFISNLRGIIYGTFIAFASIMFVMLQIIFSMNQMFQGISTALSSASISY
ncbi:MAG: hypothetical protein ACPLX8_02415, partial [Nanopusillaceae archaeon]